MRMPTLLLAVVAILPTVRVEAGQGGSDKHGNLRLEVVTFPQDVQAGFKDLNKQALLYHPIEKPEGKTPLSILLHCAEGTKKKDISSFKGNRDVKWIMKPANNKHVAKILVPQSCGLWDPDSLNKMLDHILSTHSDIDKDRVYCIGYSMGGKRTWEWSMSSPKRFAAIIPVAFIADLSKLKDMVDLGDGWNNRPAARSRNPQDGQSAQGIGINRGSNHYFRRSESRLHAP